MPEKFEDIHMSKQVLVVDDSKQTCQIIKAILNSQGFHVETKQDPYSALNYLLEDEEHNPDIIILDVMMPEMDGYQVLEKLRAETRFSETPVVMLTAKKDNEDVLKGYSKGADYYITKPANKSQILYALELLGQ